MRYEAQLLERERAPTLLAEELSPELAYASMMRYGTRRTPEGRLQSAWNHAEFALSRSSRIDEELRRVYIEYAQALLGDIIASPKSHSDTQLGAFVLSSYLPCLQKRALGEAIDPTDCQDTYLSLGAAIKYLQPLSVEEPPQWRMAEVAILAASARMRRPELLLYPGSPREEASPVAQYNHDGYFLVDSTKLAIQQKLTPSDRDYDDSITILILEPILRRACKKAGLSEAASTSEQLNHALSLIVAEAHSHELTSSEQALLNHLSSAVAHHRFAAERTVIALAS